MSLRRQITEESHLIYAAYCRGRLGQIPQGDADCAQLAAQFLGALDQARSPETPLPTAAGLAERVADQLDPPALSKPVSGAAMADAAREPGYRAPEIREQAAQAAQAAPRPARPSPRTARCIGCHGTRLGVPAPQSHARVCPDYTQEDEAWCLTQYWADNRGTMLRYEEALEEVRRDRKYARYVPPRADGVGAVQVKAGERAATCSCHVARLVHDHACPAYGPVPRPLVAAPDQPAR